jgi:uncharacterized membrane protein required for colicin V production
VHLLIWLAAVVSPSVNPSPSAAATSGAAGSTLPILDVGIVIVLVVALVIGYQNGVITPLMTELFFFGALILIYRNRTDYLNGLDKYLHFNIVLAIFAALVIAVVAAYIGSVVGQALHRMPITRGVDGFLGIFANLIVATAAIYFVLSGMIALDKAFAPIIDTAKLDSAQVANLNKQIQANPIAVALIDPKDLRKLDDQTKAGQKASLDTVSEINNVRTFYVDFVKPQLRTSRIAPFIMRIGQRIPFVGHFGPNDLPK